MIKLKDLLELNKMVFSNEIMEKHQKQMSRKNEILPNKLYVAEKPPYDNGSKETLKELHWLVDYNDGERKEERKNSRKRGRKEERKEGRKEGWKE